MKSKKQSPSDKPKKQNTLKKLADTLTTEVNNIDDAIMMTINSVIPNLDDPLKKAIAKSLSATIKDIDKEIQYIRDMRLRDFLRKHVEDKLANEFLDSLESLKIVDHLSSRSV